MTDTLAIQAGRILAKRREELGLTLREMAAIVGVAAPTLVEVEKARKGITLERLSKYAEAYGVELDIVKRLAETEEASQ
jgi:transcriptional regulator with XRE-family HTH domain